MNLGSSVKPRTLCTPWGHLQPQFWESTEQLAWESLSEFGDLLFPNGTLWRRVCPDLWKKCWLVETQLQWSQALSILLLYCSLWPMGHLDSQWQGVNIQLEMPVQELMGSFLISLPNFGHNEAESGRHGNGIYFHTCRALLLSWTIIFPTFPGGITRITNHNLWLSLGNESLDRISFGRFRES